MWSARAAGGACGSDAAAELQEIRRRLRNLRQRRRRMLAKGATVVSVDSDGDEDLLLTIGPGEADRLRVPAEVCGVE